MQIGAARSPGLALLPQNNPQTWIALINTSKLGIITSYCIAKSFFYQVELKTKRAAQVITY